MSQLECECLYCGKKWECSSYYYLEGSKPACPKCGDKKVKTRKKENSKSDIFGYDRKERLPDAYLDEDEE